jgi:hypothetical protein
MLLSFRARERLRERDEVEELAQRLSGFRTDWKPVRSVLKRLRSNWRGGVRSRRRWTRWRSNRSPLTLRSSFSGLAGSADVVSRTENVL